MDKKQIYINRIQCIFNSPDNVKKVKNIYQALITNSVYIYGAGNAGAMTYKLLRDKRICVDGFFDKRGGINTTFYGVEVYNSDKVESYAMSENDAIIIIAFMCGYDELINMQQHLLRAGWQKVYYFYDIFNCLLCDNPERLLNDGSNRDITNNETKKIFRLALMMEDDESFDIMENFFKAIVCGNTECFSLPTDKPQYFVDNVPFNKGYSRFVDCGAFDGDTAITLKKYKGNIDAIALFEPDNNNFNKLCKNLAEQRVAREQIFFPCGVWKDSKMLKFRSGIQYASAISDDGDTFIQCVSIDQAISDFAPTFIKMDIEGAEYEALMGAKQTIRKFAPDLAISVYHKIEHLWEIPLLINSIDPNYKFYLRCHGLYGMETILYATVT